MSNITPLSTVKARFSLKQLSALLIAVPLLTSMTMSSAFANGPQGRSSHDHVRAMFKGLDLTSAQKEQLRTIRKQAKDNRILYRGEREEGLALMEQANKLAAWDEAKMRSLIESKVANRQAGQLAQAKTKHAMFSVLTETQKAQLADKQATRRANKKPGGRATKQLKRLLNMAKRVDATDAQIDELKTLHTQHLVTMSALKALEMIHKKAERTLIHADEFNDAQWHELQADFKDTAVNIGLQKAQHRYSINQVFTEEQRAQLQVMKQKMEKKMKRKMKQKPKKAQARNQAG